MTPLTDIDTQDCSKFRLIGNSTLSYRFAVPHDENIFVGDILKICDSEKELTFFAKVVDLVHDSNFSDAKWDTRPHTEHFYGLGEDVYLIVEAVPLGYVDESDKFRKPKTIPSKFSGVTYPGIEDFSFLHKVMGNIEVGCMKNGQGFLEDVTVSVHSDAMRQHMGVFATTGMGKSNFMKVFCASCMRSQKFGMLMVDPHGEYVTGGRSSTGDFTSGLLHYNTAKEGLRVFTIRDDKFRARYSLDKLWLDYSDFKASDLNVLFDHADAQRDVLELLEDEEGADIIEFFRDTDFDNFDPDSYSGDYEHIAGYLKDSHPGTLKVIKRHITILVNNNREFFRKSGSSLKDIMRSLDDNRVVLIDIPGMGEKSELFVLSIITRHVMKQHREGCDWGIKSEEKRARQVLITIEEAQRVLGTGAGNTRIFRECAMEGRKFGVGLCVITQQPKNIDAKVLAQINTFVIMGLGNKGDREILANSAKQDLSGMGTEIQTLEPGEAIISTLKIPFPVSTRIHLFEDYIKEQNRKFSREKQDEEPDMRF